MKITSVYHGGLNESKPCDRAVFNKDLGLFVLFMVSQSYLYSGNYEDYAIWLLIEEFSFVMFLCFHGEVFKVLKLVRMLEFISSDVLVSNNSICNCQSCLTRKLSQGNKIVVHVLMAYHKRLKETANDQIRDLLNHAMLHD